MEKIAPDTYLKFTTEDGLGPYSGYRWPINEWVSVEPPLDLCRRGIHVCKAKDALDWLNFNVHIVQVRGDFIGGDTKDCWESARLSEPLTTWTPLSARLLACSYAEKVLPIFERLMSDDDRPRRAIEVARDYARGLTTDAARAVAWGAAEGAVRDAEAAAEDAAWRAANAAWAAAGATAWAAAEDAARAAARAAVWDVTAAARIAARLDQTTELIATLNGELHQS